MAKGKTETKKATPAKKGHPKGTGKKTAAGCVITILRPPAGNVPTNFIAAGTVTPLGVNVTACVEDNMGNVVGQGFPPVQTTPTGAWHFTFLSVPATATTLRVSCMGGGSQTENIAVQAPPPALSVDWVNNQPVLPGGGPAIAVSNYFVVEGTVSPGNVGVSVLVQSRDSSGTVVDVTPADPVLQSGPTWVARCWPVPPTPPGGTSEVVAFLGFGLVKEQVVAINVV